MARIDALSKVLGNKIFIRDLRASDIRSLSHANGEDWGDVTWHALLLRAGYLDRTFLGLNKQALGNYQPIKCFLRQGDDFLNVMDEREKYVLDFGFVLFGRGLEVSLFVDQGSKPDYTGQPVALLVFDDIRHFLNAEREQLGIRDLVEYDALPMSEIPHAYNVVDPTGAALDNWLENDVIPTDDQLYGGQGVALGKSASARFSSIDKSFNQGQIIQFRSTTPTIDPCFLEPDSSLGRVRRLADGKYHLTLYAPTQSPATDEGGINGVLARNITPSNIDLRCDIIGGGFGGRDFSIFPFYGAIAALVGQGVPVRLSQDRYAQFLSGIKRHASVFNARIAYDDQGRLLAVDAKFIFDGGSQKDLTTSIRGLAMHSSTGAYRFDHWELRALSMKNRGPLSGSMRGFGIPQVLFNVEQCIDQIAYQLGVDAIAYRKDKVLESGDLDAHKQILYHDIRNHEVLEKAESLPLWKERNQNTGSGDIRRGVGFAMAMEAYGTSSDGASVCVTLTDDFQLILHTEVIEMGQGATTGLAEVFKVFFSSRPDQVDFGKVEQLVRPVKSKKKSQIYSKAGTSSASKSMFFHGHVLETLLGIWIDKVWIPAAASIWGGPIDTAASKLCAFDEQRTFHCPGKPSIAWEQLAGAVLASKRSRVWAHGSFRGVWSWSRFQFDESTVISAWLDAIAFLPNNKWPGSRNLLKVLETVQPDDSRYGDEKAPRKTKRSVYASAAWVVAIEANCRTGQVRVQEAVCVLDAGERASDSLVKGQVEGGFVQGLGYALMEHMPQGPLGGQRLTNFHNYAIPRLKHIPHMETVFVDMPEGEHILQPIGDNDPAPPPKIRKKGIAEISITSVAPAIANAVFHALSGLPNGGTVKTRPSQLPMTPAIIRQCIKEAE